jgi:hypothetical protein
MARARPTVRVPEHPRAARMAAVRMRAGRRAGKSHPGVRPRHSRPCRELKLHLPLPPHHRHRTHRHPNPARVPSARCSRRNLYQCRIASVGFQFVGLAAMGRFRSPPATVMSTEGESSIRGSRRSIIQLWLSAPPSIQAEYLTSSRIRLHEPIEAKGNLGLRPKKPMLQAPIKPGYKAIRGPWRRHAQPMLSSRR